MAQIGGTSKEHVPTGEFLSQTSSHSKKDPQILRTDKAYNSSISETETESEVRSLDDYEVQDKTTQSRTWVEWFKGIAYTAGKGVVNTAEGVASTMKKAAVSAVSTFVLTPLDEEEVSECLDKAREKIKRCVGSDVYADLAEDISSYGFNFIDSYILNIDKYHEAAPKGIKKLFYGEGAAMQALGSLLRNIVGAVAHTSILKQTLQINILNLTANLFDHIKKKEEENPDFLVDLIFETMRKSTEKFSNNKEISPKIVLQQISDAIIDILLPDESALFLPFKDCDLKTVVRSQLYNSLKKDIIPKAIFGAFEKINTEKTRKKLLNDALSKINEILIQGIKEKPKGHEKKKLKDHEKEKPNLENFHYDKYEEFYNCCDKTVNSLIGFLVPSNKNSLMTKTIRSLIKTVKNKYLHKEIKKIIVNIRNINIPDVCTKSIEKEYEKISKELNKNLPKTKEDVEEIKNKNTIKTTQTEKELEKNKKSLLKKFSGIIPLISKKILKTDKDIAEKEYEAFFEKLEIKIKQLFLNISTSFVEGSLSFLFKSVKSLNIVKVAIKKIRDMTEDVSDARDVKTTITIRKLLFEKQ